MMGSQDADEDVDKVSTVCSICLNAVSDTGDRSWVKLLCGHQFHLDCIGSAFNVKGAMQCPNCRKIEKGQWLYASGSRAFPEFNVDDWVHNEAVPPEVAMWLDGIRQSNEQLWEVQHQQAQVIADLAQTVRERNIYQWSPRDDGPSDEDLRRN
ncbi:hypothetical protein QQ045_013538 [Rhodiola kirilowii]